jgi:adenine-specific DNA glycosylase
MSLPLCSIRPLKCRYALFAKGTPKAVLAWPVSPRPRGRAMASYSSRSKQQQLTILKRREAGMSASMLLAVTLGMVLGSLRSAHTYSYY